MNRMPLLALFFALTSLPAEAGNLMVEVRTDGQSAVDRQDIGVGAGSGWGVQGGQRTVTRRESNVQRLLVMDGGTATLSSVQTQPLRLRQVIVGPYGKIVSEGYVYRSLGGGVRVTPRSRGEQVDIEIGAEDVRPALGQPSATETTQLSTQVSGRMGEWILLGDDSRAGGGGGSRAGAGVGPDRAGGGFGMRSEDISSGQQIWLRVTPSPY